MIDCLILMFVIFTAIGCILCTISGIIAIVCNIINVITKTKDDTVPDVLISLGFLMPLCLLILLLNFMIDYDKEHVLKYDELEEYGLGQAYYEGNERKFNFYPGVEDFIEDNRVKTIERNRLKRIRELETELEKLR